MTEPNPYKPPTDDREKPATRNPLLPDDEDMIPGRAFMFVVLALFFIMFILVLLLVGMRHFRMQ